MEIRRIIPFVVAVLCVLGHFSGVAQLRVSGRVYDISKFRPLEAVSVLTTRGSGTVSDSLGRFSIIVSEADSIWFSYLNRPTPKYAVKSILNPLNFEISLHVNSTELKEVRITPPNYRLDSIQNRLNYAKAFNFSKPGLSGSVTPSGVGIDLDELIHVFQFRRNRRMMAFREQLLQEEAERFIDHRFNRALIIKLTKLRGEALDEFIRQYRPDLYFIETSTDYDLQDYIKKSFSHYQQFRNMMNQLKSR